MRFRTLFPVLVVGLGLSLGACQRDDVDEVDIETELTPADTMMMAPPPAPMDTMMMGDTTHQM